MAPTFRKAERIVSRRLIEQLFTDNYSMAAFPLRAVYQLIGRSAGDEPVQVLVSVSKKRFRHAVDRNRIKRQVREAYRLHKQVLSDAVPSDKRLLLAFIWLSDRHLPSAGVSSRVVSLLHRIAEKL